MKKIILAIVGILLVACTIATAEPSAADQKWLATVQKMTETGQAKVSTTSETRVQLLKDWAGKNGFTVEVVKTEAGFTLGVTRNVVKN